MTNTATTTDVEIYASDIVKGDHIMWKGERREVTLVSRMSKEGVYIELGELSDAIVRADDTITVEYPYSSREG